MQGTGKGRADWARSELVTDAVDFYDRLLRAIGEARETVDLEYYIFELDAVGERFVEALSAAAARGVRVRVLVDGVGSAASSERLARRLFKGGVPLQIHNPLPWLTRSFRWSRARGGFLYKILLFLLNINRRNHRKLCVVDGKTAWVGSFNITRDHLPREQGGEGWRDYALELHGGEVQDLAESFDRIWTLRGPRSRATVLARYLSNRGRGARRLKNRYIARRIRRGTRRVWLVTAYFAPTATFRRALLSACRAGKDVRILLPEQTDVPGFSHLSAHYYRELLLAGARIFLYQPGVLHAKALLVDELAVIGSSNWNYRSTLHDLELDVVIDDEATLAALESVIEADIAVSRELALEQTPSPGLASWLLYSVRYWM